MRTYTSQEKELILSYPIPALLTAMGYNGQPDKNKKGFYLSPFRNESEGSFHYDSRKNRWYDHGEGIGGGVLELVSRLTGKPKGECWDIVAGKMGLITLDGELNIKYTRPASKPVIDEPANTVVIDDVLPHFLSTNLMAYGEQRGINSGLLNHYCRQVRYHFSSSPNYKQEGIGFQTFDGWVIRQINPKAKVTKVNTGSQCTYINQSGQVLSSRGGEDYPKAGHDRVEVFEGFFDFLSWLVRNNRTKPFCDIVVLNSVNNRQKAMQFIKEHKMVSCWLDNDAAGKKAFDAIKEECPQAVDKMAEYRQSNDVNDVNDILKNEPSKFKKRFRYQR